MSKIIEILKNDGVIVFPTETVWGVGCRLGSDVAIKKLYQIKNRPTEQPTGIFVSSLQMAQKYGELSDAALELAEKYWPGPLSLVVKATAKVPSTVRANQPTVSLRMLDQKEILELVEQIAEPLVQTSANFAGETPPSSFAEIDTDFLNQIDGVVDGEASNGLPSTIIDTTTEPITVLRQGPITLE